MSLLGGFFTSLAELALDGVERLFENSSRNAEFRRERERMQLVSQLQRDTMIQTAELTAERMQLESQLQRDTIVQKAEIESNQLMQVARLEREAFTYRVEQERELEELKARLEAERIRRINKLEENRHKRKIAMQDHEFQLWQEQVKFQINAAQRMIEIISKIKEEHTRKVMDVIIEFESRYQDTLYKVMNDARQLREQRLNLYEKILPLRESTPELYEIEYKDIARMTEQQQKLVDIILKRIEHDLPALRENLLNSVQFDPVQFIAQITRGRATPKEIEAILKDKEIDWHAAKEEQKLLKQ
jgi:hypothetical protein